MNVKWRARFLQSLKSQEVSHASQKWIFATSDMKRILSRSGSEKLFKMSQTMREMTALASEAPLCMSLWQPFQLHRWQKMEEPVEWFSSEVRKKRPCSFSAENPFSFFFFWWGSSKGKSCLWPQERSLRRRNWLGGNRQKIGGAGKISAGKETSQHSLSLFPIRSTGLFKRPKRPSLKGISWIMPLSDSLEGRVFMIVVYFFGSWVTEPNKKAGTANLFFPFWSPEKQRSQAVVKGQTFVYLDRKRTAWPNCFQERHERERGLRPTQSGLYCSDILQKVLWQKLLP